jgi:UDP-galactopyranose mutase
MVGAGLSGAVTGRMLAEAGHAVTVVDARPHVAGNCHTERDAETGVLVHVYGPHIFHTDDAEVWDYVNRFETFLPYRNRVKTTSGAGLFAAGQPAHDQPVLRHRLAPRRGARLHRRARPMPITEPRSFEEQALRFVGPRALPPSSRAIPKSSGAVRPPTCPPRSSSGCRCGSTTTTTISSTGSRACPRRLYRDGRTPSSITRGSTVHLRPDRSTRPRGGNWDHVFWSGPLDGWFGHDSGGWATARWISNASPMTATGRAAR